jgi:hypothetical protein
MEQPDQHEDAPPANRAVKLYPAVLDRESAGLVYQRGGDVQAAQHRRRGEPVFQLYSRPAGDDSEPHRRAADSHAGSGFQQAFPRGYWGFLQHPATSLFSTCLGPKLFGPAGQPIPCWGDRLVQLKFQDQIFCWKFLLADVAFPILGVDFLRAHKLLIDPEAMPCLTEQAGGSPASCRAACPRQRWWLFCTAVQTDGGVLFFFSPHRRSSQRRSSQRRSSQRRTSFCRR